MSMLENSRRIVVKVGTSTLTHATGALNLRRIGALVRVLSDFKNAGKEMVLVSSGAVSAGVAKGGAARPTTIAEKQAMAAIDKMFKSLEDMGFSPMEINIFLNLKMREREEEDLQVKIALIECNPENLGHMAEQLRRVPHVELYTFLVESIEEYPYKIEDDVDLIVTTAAHAGRHPPDRKSGSAADTP